MSTVRANAFMETFTGILAPVGAMTSDHVSMKDITVSLSRINRFLGHSMGAYSVLEHSWVVSKIVRQRGYSPVVQLAALLHDAKEAYIGDIPTPVKRYFEQEMPGFAEWFEELERNTDAAICQYVGCIKPGDMYHPAVKQADIDLLQVEAWEMMRSRGDGWSYTRPTGSIHESVMLEHGALGSHVNGQLVQRFMECYDGLIEEIQA